MASESPIFGNAGKPPIIGPDQTIGSVTDKISAIALSRRTPLGWYLGFAAVSRW